MTLYSPPQAALLTSINWHVSASRAASRRKAQSAMAGRIRATLGSIARRAAARDCARRTGGSLNLARPMQKSGRAERLWRSRPRPKLELTPFRGCITMFPQLCPMHRFLCASALQASRLQPVVASWPWRLAHQALIAEDFVLLDALVTILVSTGWTCRKSCHYRYARLGKVDQMRGRLSHYWHDAATENSA